MTSSGELYQRADGKWAFRITASNGRIVATVEGSYVLLSFAPHAELPSGLFELVHISRISEQAWSLFGTEEDYLAALSQETG